MSVDDKYVWVSAMYTGEDGKAHGYISGKTYVVKVYQDYTGQIIVMPRTDIEHRLCSYKMLAGFFSDWAEVTALKSE